LHRLTAALSQLIGLFVGFANMSQPREAGPGSTSFGTFEDLNLAIIGLGVEYPPFKLNSSALNTLAKRHYPDSPAYVPPAPYRTLLTQQYSMTKVLTINEYTGIDTRSAIGIVDHPLVNMDRAPNVAELSQIFMTEGVALAVAAAQKAITEARIDISDITDVVSTTCTNSANPGFDHYVCKQLGISHTIEKVLLHGIGCSGGLAALRTAANIAMGSSFRRRPARILVIALEICSFLVRSEMDSINDLRETRIGISLFSDCASSLVLSNGLGAKIDEEPVYELLGWDHRIIPDTEQDLGFDVDPLGEASISDESDVTR
jgi:type III polyketide synthase